MLEMFEIYLPIANMTVNGLELVLLGALVGFLAGLFGVGGGFLMTPALTIVFSIIGIKIDEIHYIKFKNFNIHNIYESYINNLITTSGHE